MESKLNNRRNKRARVAKARSATEPGMQPDWTGKCDVCGQQPIVPLTGMCGPCSFGEAEAARDDQALGRIDWVIAGGESGKGARPMEQGWAQSIVDQCQAAGVPVFVKQLSGPGGRAIKDLGQFPEGLRVREYPL